MVSPKGPYSKFPVVLPVVASINPATFPLPSQATNTGFPLAGLIASSPPTPPAPCSVPLKSSPQMKERLSALALLPSSSAIRFQPSYTNFRYTAGVPVPPVLFHTFLLILRPFQSYSNSIRSEERRVGKECRSRWSAY